MIAIRTAKSDELDAAIAIDDDACALYERGGVRLDFAPTHPFVLAEHGRWANALRAQMAFFAEEEGTGPVGLLVMSRVDDMPHLEQLSVKTSFMRRGIGGALLQFAVERAGDEPLWLTTYAHLPWNRPFYERAGFAVVPEGECPAGIVAILEEQRRWLPMPRARVAMRRPGTF